MVLESYILRIDNILLAGICRKQIEKQNALYPRKNLHKILVLKHLISYLQLDVDGKELTSWSGTPEGHPKKNTSIESGCGGTKVIPLKAINENGDKVTVTKDVRIPPLSTYFEYGFTEVEGSGDSQVQLDINYQAVDLTTPETPISKVVVLANGKVWDDSGNISTDWVEHFLRWERPHRRQLSCDQCDVQSKW